MRVVLCSAFAPLDRLTIAERASAACGANQVRIEVTAAGVNFVDGLIVQGLYQIKPRLPFVPGGEIAGRISELGSDITSDGGRRLSIGDRVFVNAGIAGGFATEVVADAANVRLTPANLTDGQAATFTQSYCTARFALAHRAGARSGQWLLVLGAGGGVGLGAVDVGASMGLRVIAAASTADKRAVAEAHGAEFVIDTATEDVKTAVRSIVHDADGADGVDLVYDPVGGEAGELALRTLREDGQLLVVGFASGAIPRLPANQILLRNRRVTGVDWGGWAAKHPQENRRMIDELIDDIDAGKLSPVEPFVYPFEHASIALGDQLNRKVTGKAVLVP